MSNQKEKIDLSLEFPSHIPKSDFYPVKRTINGNTDTLNLYIWTDEDLEEAREYARKVRVAKAEDPNFDILAFEG
ncbi:hypothetical protein [Tenacibaculum agarivorans]|uniref:hypothetical protein n=1 Tax=Tenacibaculum agarivorans TaxID=1908389 RepID=UPI00094B89B9|nr:hypothetical protein [Tenacibaculum agarivorans]